MSVYSEKKPYIVFADSKPNEVGIYFPNELKLKVLKGAMVEVEIHLRFEGMEPIHQSLQELRKQADVNRDWMHHIFVRIFSITKDDYEFYDCRDIDIVSTVVSKTSIAVMFEAIINFRAIYSQHSFQKTGTVRIAKRRDFEILESLDSPSVNKIFYDTEMV